MSGPTSPQPGPQPRLATQTRAPLATKPRRGVLTPLGRKALGDITRRKGRTLLVVCGILIGVLGLTAINVAAGSMYAAFAYTANQTQRYNIALTLKQYDPSLTPLLTSQPNVKAFQEWYAYRTSWLGNSASGQVNLTIWGADDLSHVAVDPLQLTSGHWPGVGEIVLEGSDRALQSFTLGQPITVTVGKQQTTLIVSGTSRTLGLVNAGLEGAATGYMSTAGLQALGGDAVQPDLAFTVRDPSQTQQTAGALETLLTAHGEKVTGTSWTKNDLDPGPLPALFDVMRVLSIVALLLTSFLIINTISTLVVEQTSVIGTMKAIGATRGRVLRGYLTTVLIYGLLGTIPGIVLGIIAGQALAQVLTSLIILDLGPFALDPGLLALSLVVGLGIPLLAALLPLWAGTRISAREAMAAYGVSASGGRLGAALGRRLTWVSQTTWLGIRGLFRRRGRAILTLLALTFAATAFLAIQTTTYSVSQVLSQLFAQYDADIFVSYGKEVPAASGLAQLQAIPGVARVEEFESGDQLPTRWGIVGITGVGPDTQLYHYKLLAGRWLQGEEMGVIVISQVVAQKTGLHIGDTLTINNDTRSATYQIVGIVQDYNGGFGVLGTTLLPLDSWRALTGQPADAAYTFMVSSSDHSTAAVNALARQINTTLESAGYTPSIATKTEQEQRNQSQFEILYDLLYAVLALVALVGALGLFNTLTTSVLERRREIGILRSMGASGWQVARIFWIEGLSLGGLAWLIAIPIGIPAAYAFVALISNTLIPMPFAFSVSALGVMLLFTTILVTLASVLPALGAARLRIASILRYE